MNWPVGSVVQATCVIIDYDHRKLPRIVARPGELGIVIEHCGSTDTHEVQFSGGMFTSIINDPAVKLYVGAVSTVCDGQGCHPDQLALFERMHKSKNPA